MVIQPLPEQPFPGEIKLTATGNVNADRIYQDYMSAKQVTGWTNFGIGIANAGIAISEHVMKWTALNAGIELQDDIETHRYNLANKSLDNQREALGATERITNGKIKLTEKLARLQSHRDIELTRIRANATVQIAGKQAVQQAFLQRRYTGSPVQVFG